MKATDILKDEHRVIERLLDCLEALAKCAEQDGRVDAARARDALHVVQTFADRCHHGKEEERLFPLLLERGFPPSGGPVQVMLEEHEQGRKDVRGMLDSLDDAAAFARHARDYVRLLREHIGKEDECLFTMADSVLSADDQAQLVESFRNFEHDGMGPGVHEECLATAQHLAQELAVTWDAPASTACGHGCSHAAPATETATRAD